MTKWNGDFIVTGALKRRPYGNIVVSAADNHIRPRSQQGCSYTTVNQKILLAHSSAPGGQNFIRKPDFIFIDEPLALRGIGFGKKDNVQIDFWMFGQRIENRNAIRRDDFGDDRQAALHTRDPR